MSISSPAPISARGSERLARRLGFWSATGLVVGITIGSGIFRTPAVVAARVPDATLMLAVWLFGGAISLCGALSAAELAATFPRTGGWYTFLREGWGPLAGFLFGWSQLVLIRASATGAVATVFSEYLLRSFGVVAAPGSTLVNTVAATAIAATTLLNVRGVEAGAALTGLSSFAKFGGLTVLVLLSIVLGGGAHVPAAAVAPEASIDPRLFGLALISVLYAYDGFADVTFSGGEISDGGRTLPRAIIAGTLAIVAIYLAANGAYLFVNGIGGMARSTLVAADTMQALIGRSGVAFISVVVMLSTLGTLTGIMLTAPRVFFAMADDGLFFPALARVHPVYKTPARAIGLAGLLGIAFVLTRSFEQLADTFVLSIWPFYGLAVAGIYRVRRHADRPPGYRVPGYPVLPAIFIAGVVYLVANAVISDPVWTGVTFAIVLTGIPVYFMFFAPSHQHR
jgi:basic amino acid/polyamine antiporter, APA family